MKSVAVVGGGIIGLATAKALLEDFDDITVTVYSRQFTPFTTSDISGGWIFPAFSGEDERAEDLVKWTKCTIDHLMRTAAEDYEASTAITLISGFYLRKSGEPEIPLIIKNLFPDARFATKEEIRRVTKNEYAFAVFCTGYSCDCSTYLPYMMRKLTEKGVTFVQRNVHSFNEIAEKGHDVVVNCTGYYAKNLTNDTAIKPIRGQVLMVKAPWIKHFFLELDGDTYILPRKNFLVVGGTHTDDDSLTVDQQTSKKILRNACKLLPSLTQGKVLKECVGIRPGRSKVRIEVERAVTTSGRRYVLLHHYGHAGSGVTLHWGCAKHASSVLKRFLSTSKL